MGVREAVRRHDHEAELSETQASGLSLAQLGELAAPSLFSSTRCVVVRGLENLPEESVDGLLAYAADPAEDVALVLVHGGGQKGSGVLTKLRKLAGVTEVKSEELRASEYPGFVAAEVRLQGGTIEPDAAGVAGAGRRPGPPLARRRRRPAGQRLPGRDADRGEGQALLRRPGRGEVVRRRRRRVLGPAPTGAGGAALGDGRRHGAGAGHLGLRRIGPRHRPLPVGAARHARGRPGPRGRGAAVEAAHDPRPVPRLVRRPASRARSGPSPRPTPTSRARPATRRTRWSGWCSP